MKSFVHRLTAEKHTPAKQVMRAPYTTYRKRSRVLQTGLFAGSAYRTQTMSFEESRIPHTELLAKPYTLNTARIVERSRVLQTRLFVGSAYHAPTTPFARSGSAYRALTTPFAGSRIPHPGLLAKSYTTNTARRHPR